MNSSAKEGDNAVRVARAEASAWITQLHGPNRTPEMEAGFQRWLRERPENAREFEGLTEVWDLVAGGSAARGVPRLERWERSAEAQELRVLREQERQRLAPSKRRWAVAATLLVACGALIHRYWPVTSYSTEIGEQRIVQLEDGTRVSLNSNSRLSVDYGQDARHIQLKQGEALFQVAQDPQRPFIVTADDNHVTALGTSFLVRLEGDRTAITLVDGKIAVIPSPGIPLPSASASVSSGHTDADSARGRVRNAHGRAQGADHRIILSPGERLTLLKAGAPELDRPRLDTVTAWRRGEVLLNDTPLADAVAEMNRYDKTQIVIGSPEIETLNVSGLYHTGDSEGFARSVMRMYRLKVIEREGQIRLER